VRKTTSDESIPHYKRVERVGSLLCADSIEGGFLRGGFPHLNQPCRPSAARQSVCFEAWLASRPRGQSARSMGAADTESLGLLTTDNALKNTRFGHNRERDTNSTG